MPRTILLAALVVSLVPSAAAADDADELFKKSVRPLFERTCFECHSSKADELKGNLKLETLDDILKGGATGPAVIAGDLENSFLLRAIRYQADDYQMPPSGRLPDKDIALVEKWIKALKADEKRSHRQSFMRSGAQAAPTPLLLVRPLD